MDLPVDGSTAATAQRLQITPLAAQEKMPKTGAFAVVT